MKVQPLAICLSVFIIFWGCTQTKVEKLAYDKSLTANQIAQDIDVLITTLKTNHPGVYDYHSPAAFDALMAAYQNEGQAAQSVLDEYKIVSKIIAAVSDAHTYALNPYYQNILKEELLFPLKTTINNNTITINGKRLEAINGHGADDILKHLQTFANSDANTLPYKNAFIELEFPIKYFTFFDASAAFEVKLQDEAPVTVTGKAYPEGLRPGPAAPSFSIDSGTATLKIPSWEDEMASSFNQNLQAMAEQAELGRFIKTSVQKAIDAGAGHLVVDLRGNKGGKSGPAAILLSYLISEPFAYYSEISVASASFPTKAHITNQELVQLYESASTQGLVTERNGAYYFKDQFVPPIAPNPNQFKGTVEVLVDKYSLSVSTDVVAVLKKNRAVTITGAELGGSLEHYCAGSYINLKLPNSGIEVNIPLQRLKY